MINQNYTYEDMKLWDSASWKEKASCITPLARYIEDYADRNFRRSEKTEVPGDLVPEPRTKAVLYPSFKEYWDSRSMFYSCNTMMDVRWIGMVPTGVDKSADMDILLTLHVADIFDPAWAMDTMETYKDYNEYAADHGMTAIYIVTDKVDPEDMYIRIMNEAAALFHIGYRRVFLNLLALKEGGTKLSQIPGFTLLDKDRNPVPDPDKEVSYLPGLDTPLLEITDTWADGYSMLQQLLAGDRYSNTQFDRERFVKSKMGMHVAEGLRLEYDFFDSNDPGVKQYFDERGLDFAYHTYQGENWVSIVPQKVVPETKLPVVCLFTEVNYRANKHLGLTSFAYFYEFTKIAAQGDCMLIEFALETPQDNDLLSEILEEAAKEYPLDRERVYVVGHSHNGHYALAYARRHPDEVAGCVQMGDDIGIAAPQFIGTYFQISDEELERMSHIEMPIMEISGECEHSSFIPLNTDAPFFRQGYQNNLATLDRRIDTWQRRLKLMNCPEKTAEEIIATRQSSDYVIRRTGIPADSTQVLFLDGAEFLIADVKNKNGKNLLRIGISGNTCHLVTAPMQDMAWSFLRRFARNRETGELIELF